MAYNILDVIKDELKGSAEYVTAEVYDKRIQTCLTCEYLLPSGIGGGTCKRCGCFVAVKCKYAQSECPIKKWLAVQG